MCALVRTPERRETKSSKAAKREEAAGAPRPPPIGSLLASRYGLGCRIQRIDGDVVDPGGNVLATNLSGFVCAQQNGMDAPPDALRAAAAVVCAQVFDPPQGGFWAPAPSPLVITFLGGELRMEAAALALAAPDCDGDAAGSLELRLTLKEKARTALPRRRAEVPPTALPLRIFVDKLPPWLRAAGPTEAVRHVNRGETVSWSAKLQLRRKNLAQALNDIWPSTLRVSLYSAVGLWRKVGEARVPLLTWAKALRQRCIGVAREEEGKTFRVEAVPLPPSVLGPGWSMVRLPPALAQLTGLPIMKSRLQYAAYVRLEQPRAADQGVGAAPASGQAPEQGPGQEHATEPSLEPSPQPSLDPTLESAPAALPGAQPLMIPAPTASAEPNSTTAPGLAPSPEPVPQRSPVSVSLASTSEPALEPSPKTACPAPAAALKAASARWADPRPRPPLTPVGPRPSTAPARPAAPGRIAGEPPIWSEELVEALSGGDARQAGSTRRVKRPFNILTYNVGNITDAAKVEEVLFSLFDGSMAEAGWAPSLCGPDVVCLQGVQHAQSSSAFRVISFLNLMATTRGYDHVWEGELVILWNRITMERVATPSNSPDYVWSPKLLQDAWGSADARLGRLFNRDRAAMRHSDQQTFFRCPPITVVLRRGLTKSLYAVTNAHVAASEDPCSLAQLSREVRWLLGAESYERVMINMVKRKGADTELRLASCDWQYSRKGLMAEKRNDVAHLVVGDFSTQLYDKASRTLHTSSSNSSRSQGSSNSSDAGSDCGEGPDGGEPPLACLQAWAAIPGSETNLAKPSAMHCPSGVVYVLREPASRMGLAMTGFATPAPRNSRHRVRGGGAGHKPVIVSLREGKQVPEAVPTLQEMVASRLRDAVAKIQAALERAVREGTADVGKLVAALGAAAARLGETRVAVSPMNALA